MLVPRLVAWTLVAGCAAFAVLRVGGLERGFPLVPIVAYTPLVAAAAVGAAATAAALRVRAAALAGTVVAVVLLGLVAPRAIGGPTPAEGARGPQLRVLSLNLRKGGADPEAVVALVRRSRADVLSLQEVSAAAVAGLRRAGLDGVLPHRVLPNAPGTTGTALYARRPLTRRPLPRGTQNPFAAAALTVPGAAPLELFAVHPTAPQGPVKTRLWKADLRRVPPPTPRGAVRILAGDFNSTLDHAELRRVLDGGYDDAAEQVGAGLHPTWPVHRRRLPLPVTIDHVLADPRCGVRHVGVRAMPGTDHRAVLAVLELPAR